MALLLIPHCEAVEHCRNDLCLFVCLSFSWFILLSTRLIFTQDQHLLTLKELY